MEQGQTPPPPSVATADPNELRQLLISQLSQNGTLTNVASMVQAQASLPPASSPNTANSLHTSLVNALRNSHLQRSGGSGKGQSKNSGMLNIQSQRMESLGESKSIVMNVW